jgi:hypothetical protein
MEKIVFPIYINDVKKAEDFFGGVSVFEDMKSDHRGESWRAKIQVFGCPFVELLAIEARNVSELEIVGRQAPEKKWLIDIPISDAEVIHQELSQKGVRVSEIKDYPWGAIIFMTDPFGNTYMLSER